MTNKNVRFFLTTLLTLAIAFASCGCSFFAKDNPEEIFAAFEDGTIFCQTYNGLCEDKDLKLVFNSEYDADSCIVHEFYSRDEACTVGLYVPIVPDDIIFVSIDSFELGPDLDSSLAKCAIILQSMFSGKHNSSSQKKEFTTWLKENLEQASCNTEYTKTKVFQYNYGVLVVELYRGSEYTGEDCTSISFNFFIDQET